MLGTIITSAVVLALSLIAYSMCKAASVEPPKKDSKDDNKEIFIGSVVDAPAAGSNNVDGVESGKSLREDERFLMSAFTRRSRKT